MNSSSIYNTLLKTFTLAVNNKKEIDNLMNELDLIKNNIEYTLNNQQEEIYKISNINSKQTTNITLLNKKLKELSNQIINLSKNISDNTNNINTIINDLDVESIIELSQNINNFNTEITTLSTTVNELKYNIRLQ